MKEPKYLTVSNDDVIFIAAFSTDVYQSTDDGLSWSLIFKSPDGLHFNQVIKVTTANNPDFWVVETNKHNNYYIRAYSVDGRYFDGNVTWRDISVPMIKGKYIDLSKSIRSYDGNMKIFLSDSDNKAIHVLSVNDQCHHQLISLYEIKYLPRRLVVDKKN